MSLQWYKPHCDAPKCPSLIIPMSAETLNRHKIAALALQEKNLDQEAVEKIRDSYGGFSLDPNAPEQLPELPS